MRSGHPSRLCYNYYIHTRIRAHTPVLMHTSTPSLNPHSHTLSWVFFHFLSPSLSLVVKMPRPSPSVEQCGSRPAHTSLLMHPHSVWNYYRGRVKKPLAFSKNYSETSKQPTLWEQYKFMANILCSKVAYAVFCAGPKKTGLCREVFNTLSSSQSVLYWRFHFIPYSRKYWRSLYLTEQP